MGDGWTTDSGWYSGGGGGGGGGWGGNVGFEMPDDYNDQQRDGSATEQFLGGGVGGKIAGGIPPSSPMNKKSPGGYGRFMASTSGPPFGHSDTFGSLSHDSGAIDADERPLLEELGINFDHIYQNTLAVLNPFRSANASVLNDNDLAGPLVFCMIFGASLLLHGKMHFGYIYGIGVLGCLGMYALMNLMSENGLALTCAFSVMGYCLLPMSLLSLVAAIFSFKGASGLAVAIAAVLWCSLSASKLFVTALTMDKQRFLVAYPCSLFYGVFALMAIF